MSKARIVQVALTTAAVTLATGCLAEDDGGGGGQTGGDKNVEIVYGFGGEQSSGFQQALSDFQESSGITIKFTEASQSFDTLIRTRVRANNPPDIALFPQPGILKDFVAQGKMTDLSTQLDVEELQEELVPGVLEAGKVGDKYYGVPVSMNVKSLVFYPKKAFEAKGYEVPKTQQALLELTNRIQADGTAPWCFGIESGAATGWPATDWLEEFVLRIGGPEKYDQWVNHEILFTDPVVQQAAQALERLVLAEGHVFGARQGVASTAFATAANPMFNSPPRCFLHRQGNFITQKGFFPDRIVQNLDDEVGVFYFPGMSEDEQPVLGGGDLAAVFSGKDEDTRQVMQFMTGSDFPGWSEQGGFLSPRKDYDLDKYQTETTREIARIGYDATVFRFDGSDQMPGAVGSGSFWRGMVAWISGQKALDATLADIERSWPD